MRTQRGWARRPYNVDDASSGGGAMGGGGGADDESFSYTAM